MANRRTNFIEITPEVLLKAYARGIIPLDGFHVPRRLARTVRTTRFTVRVDQAFDAVIDGCARPAAGRMRTWINHRIRKIYRALYAEGHCHTVEVYDGATLVGGLYGVSLGRAFFGESMFHEARDASKIALVHLVARLIAGGYTLLDTQFVTDHLKTFGAREVPRRQYHRLLEEALVGEADFSALPTQRPVRGAEALAIIDKPIGRPSAPARCRGGSTIACSRRLSSARPISPRSRRSVRCGAPRRWQSSTSRSEDLRRPRGAEAAVPSPARGGSRRRGRFLRAPDAASGAGRRGAGNHRQARRTDRQRRLTRSPAQAVTPARRALARRG